MLVKSLTSIMKARVKNSLETKFSQFFKGVIASPLGYWRFTQPLIFEKY